MLQIEAVLTEEVLAGRALVARIGRFLFDRHLTDAGGGNISLRVGDVFCMSPTLAGQNKQWQLDPADVLVVSDGRRDPLRRWRINARERRALRLA